MNIVDLLDIDDSKEDVYSVASVWLVSSFYVVATGTVSTRRCESVVLVEKSHSIQSQWSYTGLVFRIPIRRFLSQCIFRLHL